MITYFKVFLIVIIITSTGYNNVQAQSSEENSVKSALNNLLQFSKSKSFDKAAALIAYDGEDKNRQNKDSFNSTNKEELNQVKRICKKIAALIELSSKYEFGDFTSEKSAGAEVYTIQVNFISGTQKLVTAFSFIKSGNKYLLNNMN